MISGGTKVSSYPLGTESCNYVDIIHIFQRQRSWNNVISTLLQPSVSAIQVPYDWNGKTIFLFVFQYAVFSIVRFTHILTIMNSKLFYLSQKAIFWNEILPYKHCRRNYATYLNTISSKIFIRTPVSDKFWMGGSLDIAAGSWYAWQIFHFPVIFLFCKELFAPALNYTDARIAKLISNVWDISAMCSIGVTFYETDCFRKPAKDIKKENC